MGSSVCSHPCSRSRVRTSFSAASTSRSVATRRVGDGSRSGLSCECTIVLAGLLIRSPCRPLAVDPPGGHTKRPRATPAPTAPARTAPAAASAPRRPSPRRGAVHFGLPGAALGVGAECGHRTRRPRRRCAAGPAAPAPGTASPGRPVPVPRRRRRGARRRRRACPRAASCRVDSASAPTYGGLPVRMTHRIAPRPNTSECLPIWSIAPMACSGGMYAGVPRIAPACVRSDCGVPVVAGRQVRHRRGRLAVFRRSLSPASCLPSRNPPVHDLDFAERRRP